METPKINSVIFDWAGTLFEDLRPSYLATRDTVLELGGPRLSLADYRKHFCVPVLPFYKRYGISASLKKIDEVFYRHYFKHAKRSRVFDGVEQSLKLLHKHKIKMAILSTLQEELLQRLVKEQGWQKYFVRVIGSASDKRRVLPKLLKELKSKPHQTLYIGDMDHDVITGHKAGTLTGCVLSGYHDHHQLLQHRPHFVWQNQKDWPLFFKKILDTKPVAKTPKDYPVATSGALIFNPKGEVLMILTHKWSFKYGIPGGKIEKGESAKEAVIREIKEETALNIRVQDLVMVQDCIDSDEFYVPGSHFFLFNYTATSRSTKVVLNDEAISYLWLKPKDALLLNLNEPTRILLENILTR
ncbi:MAG: HAD hydrolase-like protein [Deltaproteobacteria bacterium]|nr:HAD hydrolase-like protein [Deltaproteobacteria bacterium]